MFSCEEVKYILHVTVGWNRVFFFCIVPPDTCTPCCAPSPLQRSGSEAVSSRKWLRGRIMGRSTWGHPLHTVKNAVLRRMLR